MPCDTACCCTTAGALATDGVNTHSPPKTTASRTISTMTVLSRRRGQRRPVRGGRGARLALWPGPRDGRVGLGDRRYGLVSLSSYWYHPSYALTRWFLPCPYDATGVARVPI